MKLSAPLKYVVLLSMAMCVNTAMALEKKKHPIPIEYYDLSEISLVAAMPAKSGESAIFRDPAGKNHRVKVGSFVSTNHLALASVTSESVTVGRMLEDPEGDWIILPSYEWKIGAPPVQLTLPAWASKVDRDLLGPDEWPITIEAAVRMIISGLSDDEKLRVRNTKKADLALFHHGWGTGIRNHYGLWRGNNKLILSACGSPCHPDNASGSIILAVWAELRK
jgi:hypothetical protein